MHAGCRSRHPNKHIYLDCGKSIYSVIQHLQSTPFNLLDEAVRSVAGSSVNEEYLQHWKGNASSHFGFTLVREGIKILQFDLALAFCCTHIYLTMCSCLQLGYYRQMELSMQIKDFM